MYIKRKRYDIVKRFLASLNASFWFSGIKYCAEILMESFLDVEYECKNVVLFIRFMTVGDFVFWISVTQRLKNNLMDGKVSCILGLKLVKSSSSLLYTKFVCQ